MPIKDIEQRKLSQKEYYDTHKSEIAAQKKEYQGTHKFQITSYRKAYYQAHKEEFIAYKKEHWKKNKEKIQSAKRETKLRFIEYKGGQCCLCGYSACIEALAFHHLNPNEKEFGIGNAKGFAWERVKKELDKTILVCANCHAEIEASLRGNRVLHKEIP